MKSRITIEVDFNNGNQPVIQILQQKSEDVRDSLVQSFLQSLQHTSRWCRIIYCGNHTAPNPLSEHGISEIQRWKVETINPYQLEEEINLMKAVFDNMPPPVKNLVVIQ